MRRLPGSPAAGEAARAVPPGVEPKLCSRKCRPDLLPSGSAQLLRAPSSARATGGHLSPADLPRRLCGRAELFSRNADSDRSLTATGSPTSGAPELGRPPRAPPVPHGRASSDAGAPRGGWVAGAHPPPAAPRGRGAVGGRQARGRSGCGGSRGSEQGSPLRRLPQQPAARPRGGSAGCAQRSAAGRGGAGGFPAGPAAALPFSRPSPPEHAAPGGGRAAEPAALASPWPPGGPTRGGERPRARLTRLAERTCR